MSNQGLSKERLGRVHEVMTRHVEQGGVPGLVALVSRRGEVYVEAIGRRTRGGEPMTTDSLFRITSMTKPMTAAAAMILVEECKVRLDDPVDRLLPELASPRVLRSLESPISDTVPARRAITLRDLLTSRFGLGAVLARPGTYPIQKAMAEAGLAPGPESLQVSPDEWAGRLGKLPLVHHPGDAWMYHTAQDALGVLVARASGKPLDAFMKERLFDPLGMRDTHFSVPAEKRARLTDAFGHDPGSGELTVFDSAADSRWSRPAVFPSGSTGLVSTADDCLAFQQMLLGGGKLGNERVLSRPSVELMTHNHLTAEQRAQGGPILGPSQGWGFGMGVVAERWHLASPGQFGWNGGLGTSSYADPREGLVVVLLTQKAMTSPSPLAVLEDFWTLAYQALGD